MAANIEAKITDNTREAQVAKTATSVTRDFSQGALKDLKRNKTYVFFDPFDTSLSRLVAANKPFWYLAQKDNISFMNTLSRPSQVAIFPEPARFYVPESNNLSLDGQIRRQREDLEEEIRGECV